MDSEYTLLDSCLIGEWEEIDPVLPKIMKELQKRKSALCWHKHGTFYEHLVGVTRVCVLWQAPVHVTRCALVHSAYSNSYVNLCLFNGKLERPWVSELVGGKAEELTHMFCTVDRHKMLFEVCDPYVGTGVPPEGLGGLSRQNVAYFLFLTLADFSEQLYSWQDDLFGNTDSRLSMDKHFPGTLWPGIAKPGLYLSKMSRIGRLLRSCQDLCPLPPVFNHCQELLDETKEIEARDLYWQVITSLGNLHEEKICIKAEQALRQSIELNPYVGEPCLLLCQILLFVGEWGEALEKAKKGLELLACWGSPWDKRMSFGGWVSWARALALLAQEKRYPKDAFGMINLGLTVPSPQ